MSPKVRCLLDDLRALSTQDVSGLSGMEANDLYIALQLATVSVDAAQVVAGNFDWKDERSRKFGNFCQRDNHPEHGGRINTETAAANAQVAAAAPDLLALLKEWDEPGACGCDTATCRETCLPARTRAAIAKATT